MGYTAKKKKRGGGSGGKRNKGRTTSKDHSSNLSDDNELLSEEITALCSIFQEDCRVVSDSPPQVDIKLRPYSKDMGYEDAEVSALLSVKYLPGYPYKSPKLQITPEKGLVKADVDKLLSLLHDQANLNAREGRVMIFNLVEAAQEFLSEIVPVIQSSKSVACPATNESSPLFQTEMTDSNDKRGPFVYGYIDLFGGSGELWSWRFGMDEKSGLTSAVQPHSLDGSKFGNKFEEKKLDKNLKSLDGGNTQGQPFSPFTKLDTLEEESEDGNKSLTSRSSRSLIEDLVDSGIEDEKQDLILKDNAKEEEDVSDSEPSEWSFSSLGQDQVSQIVNKDLMMVHLLRLACAKKGPLADALPQIISELYNLGMLSDLALELASKPSSTFEKQFDHVFRQYRDSSHLSQFWKPAFDLGTSLQSSRYLNDFEELKSLGHGGFGHVVLCKNKLDGRQYAVKKIRLKDKSLPDHILREVATLSRLQHQHVVRYYQAWFETGVFDSHGDSTYGSMTPENSTFSYKDSSATDMLGGENKMESTYLYIQMEYCPRTLRQVFESYRFDKELAWHLFRQIVEGLAHIHSQGIIHRDLTPNNIFFDARNDIKIGDFGLAKFLKLEQLDQDLIFPDTTGVSIDGTGQVGTYFYRAPEIEQGWPKIDEKADMYSLGIVFFELWHPFGTAMERNIVLSDLKLKIELPSAWVADFPEQASLLKHLMSSSPTDRPSAQELLRHSLPPRMESELLDNILRRMKAPEDSSVYDKVVNAIFDEEMLGMKDDQDSGEKLRLAVEDASSIQYTEVRDYAMEVAREVFRRQGAKHLEINPMHLLDECPLFNRNTVKLLTNGGDMLELCYELRIPFLGWVISNQKSSFKRYEVACVYRKAIGHSPPNRYLQGDYDIIGGAPALTEAEVIKVTMDIVSCFFHSNSCDIHLNHGDLLDAIWSWVGVKTENRHKVAELLSIMGSLRPQSSERKSKWVVIRRQLLQELNLAEAVVNRLQTVAFRFCGAVDMALPRLRGALPTVNSTWKALDELSDLFRHLTVWRMDKNVYIDVLMPPPENYYRDLFFQIYLMKENHSGSHLEGSLLAVGGRYDYLLHQMWTLDYKTNPPGGVGTSIALETIIQQCPIDFKPVRNETGSTGVLVCSKGGRGLLAQRMELVAELWEENIKAEFFPAPDPSLTEQYEYANEHDIKCLVIITDTGVSFRDSVKVRHLELKKEKEIAGGDLAKFLLDAMATQFKNPSIWS